MSVQRSPRRKQKQISQNVRELHKSLGATLNDAERRSFIQTLNQYQKNRNIKWLVSSLHSILNTPEKREIYPKLRTIIPKGEQAQLDRYWQSGTRVESPQRSRNKLRGQVANSSSLPEHLDRYASLDSGVDLRGPPSSRKTSPTRQSIKEKYPVKRFYLKRNTNTGFGFSVRGGSEHGIGLYISLVDENSISEKQGLLPGDHILFVNGTRFDGLTHGQAVQVCLKLNRSTSQCFILILLYFINKRDKLYNRLNFQKYRECYCDTILIWALNIINKNILSVKCKIVLGRKPLKCCITKYNLMHFPRSLMTGVLLIFIYAL